VSGSVWRGEQCKARTPGAAASATDAVGSKERTELQAGDRWRLLGG